MKYKNKTVWITGASSGVGEGLAQVFHREGANLIISARREDELERVKASCTAGPGSIDVVAFDLVDESQRSAAAEKVLNANECIDVLINNAGIGQRSLIKDTSLDVDRRIMELDYFAPIALTRLVLPRMMEQQDGHIVVTSSVAGKHGMSHHAAYCAAKHALHGYYESLRIEMLDYNIRVCLLVIAGVRSNVFKHALLGDGSEYGNEDWGGDAGMSAEECAEKTITAMLADEYEPVISIEAAAQAMKIKEKDPVEFTKRMHKVMQWMESS
jgi:short-subunit dehydrogenase